MSSKRRLIKCFFLVAVIFVAVFFVQHKAQAFNCSTSPGSDCERSDPPSSGKSFDSASLSYIASYPWPDGATWTVFLCLGQNGVGKDCISQSNLGGRDMGPIDCNYARYSSCDFAQIIIDQTGDAIVSGSGSGNEITLPPPAVGQIQVQSNLGTTANISGPQNYSVSTGDGYAAQIFYSVPSGTYTISDIANKSCYSYNVRSPGTTQTISSDGQTIFFIIDYSDNGSCAPPPQPSCSSATPDGTSVFNNSTQRVTASGVTNATSVTFPTWSDVGGQNDLVWYSGINAGGGTWYIDINMANHPGDGIVRTHVYMNNASYLNQWCDQAYYVTTPPTPPTCSSATPDGDVTTANSGIRRVYANGVGNATSVLFPTWSAVSGQDDLVWYPGINAGGGTWYADQNLASHPGLGDIYTHVYMFNANYANQWCDSANFIRELNCTPPTTGVMTAPASAVVNSTFNVSCSYGSNVNYITVPGCTWTGWTGNTADFSCVAPATAQSKTYTCTPLINNSPSNFCSVPATVSKTVSIVDAPVNGGWGPWTPASCPTACGLPASTLTRSCDNPTPANGGTQCTADGSSATQNCAATAACATTPTISNVTISSPTVKADNSTQYNIVMTVTDSGGGAKITHEYALINYQGSNAGAYRGYPTWYYDGAYTGWNGLKNKQSCTGGGIGAIQSGYGDSYINLDSCSTSVSGNTRTTTFTVRFAPSFTTPVTNNDISGWTRNTDVNDDGWDNFDINFGLFVNGPNAPTITGPTTGNPSTSYTYNFTATDPTGYGVRYGIDWDMNATADELLPAGYISSGTSRSTTYSWPTTGTKTFQALTQNEWGVNSGWTTYNVTLGNVPTVIISASPDPVPYNTASTLTWSSTGATSCTASGTGWSGSKITSGTQSTGNLIATQTYTLTCTGTGGSGNNSVTVNVDAAPTPDLTAGAPTPSTATTNVAQTYTATITNSGNASTGASFSNFFQTATATNGGGTITDRTSSTMTTLASGASNTATSPSITFATAGTYSIRVCADKTNSASTGSITESNEGNNCGSWTNVTVANAPVPVVTISASPTSGTAGSVNPTIAWSATNSPTSCTATGDWTTNGAKAVSGTQSQGILTTAQTYTYTLTCSNIGGASSPVSATVVVSVAPMVYTLTNSGTSNVTKTSGNAFTTNTITKTLTSGTTQPVTITATGMPSGVSVAYDGNRSCSPNCTSVITFTVPPSTPVGTFPITVTGSPASANGPTTFNLVISGNPMIVTVSSNPTTALIGQNVTWTATVTSGGTAPFTYSWSGTNIPTSPAPSTNTYSRSYSTIGQKTATVTVTDADGLQVSQSATIQISFDPQFEEF